MLCTSPCVEPLIAQSGPIATVCYLSALGIGSPRAVATLAVLLAVVLPAAAQPLRPALKQAQCPVSFMQSGGYCTPLLRNAPPSTEKRGVVPRSPLIPRKAFRLSPYPPL